MKAIKFTKHIVFLTTFLFITSCDLVDVTDIQPVYQVSEKNVITNIDQAQTALYGTYGILIDGLEFTSYVPGFSSLMGLTMKVGSRGPGSFSQFFNNEVTSENAYIELLYTKMYFLLNNANHIITKTEKLDSDDSRKNEIIAEAKTLRALTNFYLLRFWGQFFDENSNYGIVLKEEPISDAIIQGRANVKDTYALILEDLDYAIQYGPDFSNTFYTSNLFAKALKSKVLLYKKDYTTAAKLALEVIEADDRTLEDAFADIFTKKIANTKEVLFQTPFDNANDRNNKAFIFRSYFGLTDFYKDFMEGDLRKSAAIASNGVNNKFNNSVYNGEALTADTEYFMRLGEVYLIYAEAVLRGDDDIEASLDALNMIRERSDNTLIETADKTELLEAIRKEKIYELGGEGGEEWFDLVRYYKEGDLDINDFKPISSDSKLILPIPFQSVKLSNNMIDQNPDY
ncbi:RagB/SusD family nutrient uptake outer membrane protein [Algibacter miyuki]|uniref:RagB/SusD family nutrient uptake outer membrane protein n=1 Tax=Algibacter miyuki TaxID=1306933 RepID=A0ABV5H4N3_9FLAO|nr:RagB/SusD family nutrient uptake outer membrane protein [Algibacter miyuki]MDN3665785.1 RagB/SusD family nutrient uptake outer membrane protein [Algibacter miyuki]